MKKATDYAAKQGPKGGAKSNMARKPDLKGAVKEATKTIPTGFAKSNITPLRMAMGWGLVTAGFGALFFMEWQPHQIMSPIQFELKNRNLVLFPTKDTPHYQILVGRESMSLYFGGLQL